MNFGSTLVGAVLGTVVGVAVHLGLQNFAGMEGAWVPWLSILTGILAGVGVRKMDANVANRASYLRGGLTALIALAGIVGGSMAGSKLKQEQLKDAAAKPLTMPVIKEQPAEEEGEEGDAEEAEPEPVVEEPAMGPTLGPVVTGNPKRPQRGFAVMDFLPIAIGCFLAYELARGGGNEPPAEEENSGNADLPPEQDPVAAVEGDAENKEN